MKTRRITELAGWYGVLTILGAYAASNLGALALGSLTYKLLNLTGATALIADSWPDRNWQVIALNGVWIVIALIAIFHS